MKKRVFLSERVRQAEARREEERVRQAEATNNEPTTVNESSDSVEGAQNNE